MDVPIVVSGIGIVTNLNFDFDALAGCDGSPDNSNTAISHSYIGDLSFRLTSPSGRSVRFQERKGGNRDNICLSRLDDDGGFPSISTLTSIDGQPQVGNYAPEDLQEFVTFDGENANGVWILNVSDNDDLDEGIIRRFSLAFNDGLCSGGTPTPTATPTAVPTPGYEGDIAPRPLGDGAINSTDVIQIRRFATGLDTPNPATNEAQRADTAPRATLGDGVLNSADVIQSRRYAAGLDPLTGAGGTAAPNLLEYLFGKTSSNAENRLIKLGFGSALDQSDGVVRVPVYLESQGEVGAISFSVGFDPQVLGNPRLLLPDPSAGDTVVTLNRSLESSGRIGVLIDSSQVISTKKEIGWLVFDRRSNVGHLPFELIDAPVTPSASDTDGKPLSVSFSISEVQEPSIITRLFGYASQF